MVERGVGLDPVRKQLVDKAIVEIQSPEIGPAGPIRKHSRPCDREAVDLDAELLDQPDVLFVAMIVLIGAVAAGSVLDLARRVAENVPDRLAAAVLVDSALDLVGRGRRTHRKSFGKRAGAWRSAGGGVSTSAASARVVRPSAARLASLAKEQR